MSPNPFQIPLDDMFRYILRVERRDGRDHYDPRRSSENSFLRLFAFSTTFVYLLREGLATFNTPRFRQFAKRLGQMIMHTVEYVSDHWAAFKMSKGRYLNDVYTEGVVPGFGDLLDADRGKWYGVKF